MIKVGDILYGRESYRRETSEIKEYIVEKVGRIYFYVENQPRRRYNIETLQHFDKDYGQLNHQLYRTAQEIQDKIEHERLSDTIKSKFRDYGKLPYTLEQLKQINEILK